VNLKRELHDLARRGGRTLSQISEFFVTGNLEADRYLGRPEGTFSNFAQSMTWELSFSGVWQASNPGSVLHGDVPRPFHVPLEQGRAAAKAAAWSLRDGPEGTFPRCGPDDSLFDFGWN